MESLARLVAIILSTALAAGIIAVVLWRKPPRNIIARAFFTVLMIPVICIGIFFATLSIGIGVRALGLAISIAAVMAIRSLLSKK